MPRIRPYVRLAVLAFALTASAAFAGEAPAAPPASHLKAAEEVLAALDMETLLSESIDSTLRMQMEANPMLKDFEDIMRSFLRKYLGWESIKPQVVTLYAEAFTEPELKQLGDFYRTPLGAKVAKLMPVLLEKGGQIGQAAVEAHQGELEEAIGKRIEEMSKSQGGEEGDGADPTETLSEDGSVPTDEVMNEEVPAEEGPAEQSTDDAPPAP